MYFTKLISITLAVTVAAVTAAPFQLKKRESNPCLQLQVDQQQAASYFQSATAGWNGSGKEAITQELSKFKSAADNINELCARIDQALKNSGQSYQSTESQNSNLWG